MMRAPSQDSLITAAITTFNAARTVTAALDSALAQDWPNLEVIVIDDASSDNTVELIDSFIRQNQGASHNIQLLRNPTNMGVAASRNRLLAAARGTFIAFFDDDDVSRPDRVTRQFERLMEAEHLFDNDLVICHTAREQVFDDGGVHYEATMGTDQQAIPRGKAVADRILIGRLNPGVTGSCATCSQFARKALYERLGGFDTELRRSEDTDFNIRLALAGGVFAGIADPLVRQTMTTGGHKRLSSEHDGYTSLLKKHWDYLARSGWSDFFGRWQALRLAHLQGRHFRVFILLARLGIAHPVQTLKKLYWSLPARHTRQRQRRWHTTVSQGASGQ